MVNAIFALSKDVRYVAIYRDGHLETKSKEDTLGASSSDSDRYEELLVNPTLITLATQRGNIDCGGLDYLIIWEFLSVRLASKLGAYIGLYR
jgi:hypothetical protein